MSVAESPCYSLDRMGISDCVPKRGGPVSHPVQVASPPLSTAEALSAPEIPGPPNCPKTP